MAFFLCAVLAAAYTGRRVLVEKVFEYSTGVPVMIESVEFRFSDTALRVKGMQIGSPRGFREPWMARIPQLDVSFDVTDLVTKRKIHIEILRLDVQELILEKNAEGEWNVMMLKGFAPGKRLDAVKISEVRVDLKRVRLPQYGSSRYAVDLVEVGSKNQQIKHPDPTHYASSILASAFEKIDGPASFKAVQRQLQIVNGAPVPMTRRMA